MPIRLHQEKLTCLDKCIRTVMACRQHDSWQDKSLLYVLGQDSQYLNIRFTLCFQYVDAGRHSKPC